MKTKHLYLLIPLLAMMTCSKVIIEEPRKADSSNFLVTKSGINDPGETYMEQAFPGEEKEIYTFPNGLVVQKFDNTYILGGDIILPQHIVDSLNNLTRQRSAIQTISNKFWLRGIVYYSIDPNMSNPYRVTAAISHWESQTGIRFQQRTNQSDYIEFVSLDPSSTYCEGLGKAGGRQRINLATWATDGSAIHEIGHALGLYHEHSRQDRDNYINILYNNIPQNYHSQYNIYNRNEGIDHGNFDFNSIMLYSSWTAFNDTPTLVITKKDGSEFSAQRFYLSSGDIASIQYIYGPPYAQLRTSVISYTSNVDGGLDEYSASYANEIYFYADKDFRNPITTSSPRLLTVRYDYSIQQENTGPGGYSNTVTIVIPAGVTSYSLPDTYSYYKSEYGYLRISENDLYYITGIGF